MTEDETVGLHYTDSIDMSLTWLREIAKDREDWHTIVYGVTKRQIGLRD